MVVQLFAVALPKVLASHGAAMEKKQRNHQLAVQKAYGRGDTILPEMPMSKEELSYRGGPGFCVELANAQLVAMLGFEQELGIPLTLAAVGDGSWSPRLRHDTDQLSV